MRMEDATPATPVSIDEMGLKGQSMLEGFKEQLARTDALFGRHDALFVPTQKHDMPPDNEEVLNLTEEIARGARADYSLQNGLHLAFAVAQVAGAGARLAKNPIVLNPSNDAAEGIRKGLDEEMAVAYETTLAGRVKGSPAAVPLARRTYPGCLMEIHLAFWSDPNRLDCLTPELRARVEAVTAQFSLPHNLSDTRRIGRPDRQRARELFAANIQAYAEHFEDNRSYHSRMLMHSGLPRDLSSIFKVLRATRRGGCRPDEGLQVIARNSTHIGRTAKEPLSPSFDVRTCETVYELDIFRSLVVSAARAPSYGERLGQVEDAHLARNFIALRRGGETHRNLQSFSAAVLERVGVEPPILYETKTVYVDPAAMFINFRLLPVADNYLHIASQIN